MKQILILLVVVVVVGGGAWWFFGQPAPEQEVEEQEEQVSGEEPQPAPTSEEVIVRATDSGYEPSSITVKEGTTVTFENESSRPVQTASDVHPIHQMLPGFDALRGFAPGESYSFTFQSAGTWRYHNHLQPQQTGIVIVE